jgi:HEPN domain-containing protein
MNYWATQSLEKLLAAMIKKMDISPNEEDVLMEMLNKLVADLDYLPFQDE